MQKHFVNNHFTCSRPVNNSKGRRTKDERSHLNFNLICWSDINVNGPLYVYTWSTTAPRCHCAAFCSKSRRRSTFNFCLHIQA